MNAWLIEYLDRVSLDCCRCVYKSLVICLLEIVYYWRKNFGWLYFLNGCMLWIKMELGCCRSSSRSSAECKNKKKRVSRGFQFCYLFHQQFLDITRINTMEENGRQILGRSYGENRRKHNNNVKKGEMDEMQRNGKYLEVF